MKRKAVGNFPILRVKSDDVGRVVRIFHDNTPVYIAIQCNGRNLNELHHTMRQVHEKNSWMPNLLPPTTYLQSTLSQQTPIPFLAVECFNRVPICDFRGEWYFIKNSAHYCTGSKKWNSVSLYPTLRFKKLIWSLFKTVLVFTTTDIRPMLDLNSMFASKDHTIIFSRYEVRDAAQHDGKFEAGEIIRVLKDLVKSKARTSDTLKAEFEQLYVWLISSDSPFGAQPQNGKLPPLKNAMKNVVFWDCRIRITYIQLLGDSVIRDAVDIFAVAKDAFAQQNTRNWREAIETWANPVLMEVLRHGDKYYKEKMGLHLWDPTVTPPSFLRNHLISSYTPKDVLRSGVVRIRDSFFHVYKIKQDLVKLYKNSDLSDEDLQGMYQYIFPHHMVKLAEVQDGIKFDAVEFVFGSFAQTQVADVQADLP